MQAKCGSPGSLLSVNAALHSPDRAPGPSPAAAQPSAARGSAGGVLPAGSGGTMAHQSEYDFLFKVGAASRQPVGPPATTRHQNCSSRPASSPHEPPHLLPHAAATDRRLGSGQVVPAAAVRGELPPLAACAHACACRAASHARPAGCPTAPRLPHVCRMTHTRRATSPPSAWTL